MVHVGEGAVGYHGRGRWREREVLVERACRVDDGVILHEGVEAEGNTAHLGRRLCHVGGMGVVQGVVMEFRVKFNVVLGRGAAVDGRNMRGKVSRALSSLLISESVIILIRMPKPAD